MVQIFTKKLVTSADKFTKLLEYSLAQLAGEVYEQNVRRLVDGSYEEELEEFLSRPFVFTAEE